MGGISTSELYLNNDKNLIFNGNLSLENNGGFTSSRMGFEKGILKEENHLKLKSKEMEKLINLDSGKITGQLIIHLILKL